MSASCGRWRPHVSPSDPRGRSMPRDSGGGQGKSKPEMIREVLEEDPETPAPRIRAAVWERYGAEVTTQEVAQVRKKLRQAQAPPGPVEAAVMDPPRKKPERPKKAAPPADAPRKKPAPV